MRVLGQIGSSNDIFNTYATRTHLICKRKINCPEVLPAGHVQIDGLCRGAHTRNEGSSFVFKGDANAYSDRPAKRSSIFNQGMQMVFYL